jgi:SAM-dependent methyltransferase
VNGPAGRRAAHPVFAALYPRMARGFEAGPIGAARRELLAGASGVVVDLGAGIGLNLPHLVAARDEGPGGDPAVTSVHLVEPDPHMVRRLKPNLPADATAQQVLVPQVTVHQVGAERLPFPDGSVDTVLATLTLCTVGDLPAAVEQIRRVLRPGGRLLVLEHVRSLDRRVAAWQDRLQRPWRWFGAGCNPNRDTGAALAAAGFDTSGLSRFTVPGATLTHEWITGSLTRPG